MKRTASGGGWMMLLTSVPHAHSISAPTFLGSSKTAVLLPALMVEMACSSLPRVSTMKTSVLLSSIFFMADSVVSGYLRMAYESRGLTFGTDLREYLGVRSSRSVFGRWNFVLYRWVTVFLELPVASEHTTRSSKV